MSFRHVAGLRSESTNQQHRPTERASVMRSF
jgi:hypothetical protein